jgi:hypothetical protein
MNTWNKGKIASLLGSNNLAVERAILALYKRQTQDEKCNGATKHSNGVGFSAAHSKLGTYYAKWLLSGHRLSGNHFVKAREITFHYLGQLVEIANSHSNMKAE